MNIRAIESAKQQWQSAADLMPQLICLTNGDGRLLRINRTLEWWGLGSVADAKGRDLHDILHPGCESPACYFRQFWLSAAPARQEKRSAEHEAFDSVLKRHFSIRVQPVLWQGHLQQSLADELSSVVIVEDISIQKKAEAGIRLQNRKLTRRVAHEVARRALSEEMQARLLAVLEKTSDYVAMTDPAGAVLYMNPAGRALLGLGPEDDLAGKNLCDTVDTEDGKNIRDVAVPSAIKNGLWSGDSRMHDSTGRQIHASQVIIAHRGADGKLDCLSAVLRDISGRVSAEQALRNSQAELRQLSELLVSIQEDERRRIALDLHDGLGQSLSVIKLLLENVGAHLDQGATAAAQAMLRQAVYGLRDAARDVSRVATELRPSILDDLGILPTLSWFFRELEAACGSIEVEKVLQVREEDVPESLKITLFRVIQEASSNIIKHAKADRMTFSLCREGDLLHLMIVDNGCGFDPDRLSPRLASQAIACCGLGLVSMKERVSLSGGAYRLESSHGLGTKINATWPLAAKNLTPEPA
jgi:PAS domain S-box-containing protein